MYDNAAWVREWPDRLRFWIQQGRGKTTVTESVTEDPRFADSEADGLARTLTIEGIEIPAEWTSATA